MKLSEIVNAPIMETVRPPQSTSTLSFEDLWAHCDKRARESPTEWSKEWKDTERLLRTVKYHNLSWESVCAERDGFCPKIDPALMHLIREYITQRDA